MSNSIPTPKVTATAKAIEHVALIERMVREARGYPAKTGLDPNGDFDRQCSDVIRFITATEAVRAIGSLSPP